MVNEEMIKLIIKKIETEPTTWDQGSWVCAPIEDMTANVRVQGVLEFESELSSDFCNTTMCMAGHTVVHNGFIPLFDDGGGSDYCLNPDTGTIRTIESLAAELLGLNERQMDFLFGSMTTDIGVYKDIVTEATGVTFEE